MRTASRSGSIRSRSRASKLLLPLLLALAGCETERTRTTSIPGVTGEGWAPPPRERMLVEHLEKDPKDVRSWFALGQLREDCSRFAEAAEAYERGNALLEPGRYTLGDYCLARVYMHLGDWDRSVLHLNRIFALEPKDPSEAWMNENFREAHFLRGAMYSIARQSELAKAELDRFLALGGDPERVEELQDAIDPARK